MSEQQQEHTRQSGADYQTGLTGAQVRERQEAGQTNAFRTVQTKSYWRIIRDNLFTFFNILNVILAVLVCLTGQYKDAAFMLLIIANLAIGISQEIASKKTLDKLSLVVAADATVIRDGQELKIPQSDVVVDDILLVRSGNQIVADADVVHGQVEVNEAMITGESDTITKGPGDRLHSGSYVVSGAAYAHVDKVGAESYANRISSSIKQEKKHRSELQDAVNGILRIVSIIVIPIGVLMFWRQAFIDDLSLNSNILHTVAAMIGMIPEGLFLLTSMSLATSAVILAYKKTLVQNLYCIETLARVDVLCLDKTGTITEGKMHVAGTVPIRENTDIEGIMKKLGGAFIDQNSTMLALRDHFGSEQDPGIHHVIPFSSARKFSGASYDGQGTYVIGAFEFVFPKDKNEALASQSRALAAEGNRVLVLAHSPQVTEGDSLPDSLEPLAFILVSDKIRPDAEATMKYFYNQGVDLKVISGDSEATVQQVARKVGIHGADRAIDATTLKTEDDIRKAVRKYNIFGRVTPEQKKQMVQALEKEGHTVAMTGDGVNDVQALREADCSVAMASGSQAAKNISTLVLLDSDFAHMPEVVAEGRKVVNNIQRVATLFVTKIIYAILVAVSSMMLLSDGYPFSPLQLTLISFVTIGFPSFFLALEPNNTRIKGNFLVNVFQRSLPGGISVVLGIYLVELFSAFFPCTADQVSTMAILTTTIIGMLVVIKVSRPFTLQRGFIVAACVVIFVLCYYFLGWFFDISELVWQQWVFIGAMGVLFPFLTMIMEKGVGALLRWLQSRPALRRLAGRLEKFSSQNADKGVL
ncbi:MAG: cation-translocating P-type ATPase [Clostridia bacterium]|nr:cation-translocating P-type ATPase [Clostridia bacterium]